MLIHYTHKWNSVLRLEWVSMSPNWLDWFLWSSTKKLSHYIITILRCREFIKNTTLIKFLSTVTNDFFHYSNLWVIFLISLIIRSVKYLENYEKCSQDKVTNCCCCHLFSVIKQSIHWQITDALAVNHLLLHPDSDTAEQGRSPFVVMDMMYKMPG